MPCKSKSLKFGETESFVSQFLTVHIKLVKSKQIFLLRRIIVQVVSLDTVFCSRVQFNLYLSLRWRRYFMKRKNRDQSLLQLLNQYRQREVSF